MTKLFISFLLIIACRTTEVSNNCESKLDHSISQSWKFDSATKSVRADEKFLTELDSGEFSCIYGKDTSFVKKKFGVGYTTDCEVTPKIRATYHYKAISYPLFPCSKKFCTYYQFYFDKDGIVRRSGKITLELTIMN